MNSNLFDTYKFLEKNCKPEAADMYYALEFLEENIRRARSAMSESIKTNMQVAASDINSNRLAEMSEYLANTQKYIQTMEKLENSLEEFLNKIAVKETEVLESIKDEDNEEEEQLLIPNYQDYEVNREVPHMLTENFTYKKACGFMFEGVRYNVKNWKYLLAYLCEILIKKDPTTFEKFANSKQAKGNKIDYFSKSGKGDKYYLKIKNTNWYTWTNRSVNAICSTIRSLLITYNMQVSSLYVYLRADLTPYRLINNNPNNNEPHNDYEEKVGKRVRNKMRSLSNNDYKFSADMMVKLTSGNESLKLFGIGMPFFKEVKNDGNISDIIKDSRGYNRYWKEIFRFNNHNYVIVSQWTKGNIDRFDKWFDGLE